MRNSNTDGGGYDDWMEKAVEYAEQYGWQVVPLSPSPDITEEESDDSVIRLLGRSPLVEVPGQATSHPEEIRQLTGRPTSSLAVLTGEGSSLVALEIGPAAKRGLEEEALERFRQSLPETRRVLGPDRVYHLFSLCSVDDGPLNLPRLTRSDGIILHGEGSLIRVPGPLSDGGVRPFRWDFQSIEGIAPFPKELLSFFGVKTGVDGVVSWRKQPNGSPAQKSSSGTSRKTKGGNTALKEGSTGNPKNRGGSPRKCSLPFRSGEQLDGTSEGEKRDTLFPWLAEGALSVLCGPTKTAGKSTFVANLAAHLAGGREFLGEDLMAERVVLLSDFPASQFRSLLSRIGIDREARDRLYVLHPKDVSSLSWQKTLTDTFQFAGHKGAGLVIIDSLDQFISVKGSVDPKTDQDLIHMLKTQPPPETSVLAVKALSLERSSRMSCTIDRLGLLGKAADVIIRMSSGMTESSPNLRRLQFASRLEGVPTHLLCEMIRGRYQKVRRHALESDIPLGDGAASQDLAQGDGAVPDIIDSEPESGTEEGSDVQDGTGPRPSIVHQELTKTS